MNNFIGLSRKIVAKLCNKPDCENCDTISTYGRVASPTMHWKVFRAPFIHGNTAFAQLTTLLQVKGEVTETSVFVDAVDIQIKDDIL